MLSRRDSRSRILEALPLFRFAPYGPQVQQQRSLSLPLVRTPSRTACALRDAGSAPPLRFYCKDHRFSRVKMRFARSGQTPARSWPYALRCRRCSQHWQLAPRLHRTAAIIIEVIRGYISVPSTSDRNLKCFVFSAYDTILQYLDFSALLQTEHTSKIKSNVSFRSWQFLQKI